MRTPRMSRAGTGVAALALATAVLRGALDMVEPARGVATAILDFNDAAQLSLRALVQDDQVVGYALAVGGI